MTTINANYANRVCIDTNSLQYAASPAPGVLRKRLELLGEVEHGRVTSIVRYEPGARFPAHDHPGGEEILVLEGEWCDERGRFGAGVYQMNPEGFRHAPYTDTGCTLFVKLRQYDGPGRDTVLIDTRTAAWVERELPGVSSIVLYRSQAHPEFVRLTRIGPGAKLAPIELPEGEEIFVLSGSFFDEYGRYGARTWLRLPPGSVHTPQTDDGCVLYVKSGGFPRAQS